MRFGRARAAHLAAVALATLAAGGCGSASSSSSAAESRSAHGSVAVIYAGSLSKLMEDSIGPAFERATGYSFEGFGGGSGEDAKQIKAKVRRLDVFVSASAEADRELEGAAGGNWVSWYATFASTPLVLGYDPASSFGRELAAGEPWYRVLSQPGIKVGRTDPRLDPKGALTLAALAEAAKKLGDPHLASLQSAFPVFPETDLVGRLQAGQLDAGFLYAVEANVAKIPTVALAPAAKSAEYTVSVLNQAPDPAGAAAFVRYLLKASSAPALVHGGLGVIAPARLSGGLGSVPGSVRASLSTTP